MTITISIPPNTQRELEQQALAAGTDVTSFVLGAVQEKLAEKNGDADTQRPYDEWSRDFHAWVAGQRSRNPGFDDSRDSIYD
jgi:hypothetical protein